MTSGPPFGDQKLNADVPWDDFDPHEYIRRNYLVMQGVDEEIVSLLRDHFSDHFRGRGERVAAGIDVGAGPNLYPALSMLPWCDSVTLLERSTRNLEYLRGQAVGYDAHWDQFWAILSRSEGYAGLELDPRVRFKEAAQIHPGSLFDLCRGERRWGLGTMFFVAESITTSLEEFRRGVHCFMNALDSGAPFGAAFVEHSEGYSVSGVEFPARYIDECQVREALAERVSDVRIYRIVNSDLLRDGYTGMILACGVRK
jgi:hypothetical protein